MDHQYAKTLYRQAREKLKEPDGEHCIICSNDLPKRRQKYCSDECLWDWWHSLNIPTYTNIPSKVFKRDKYQCQLCRKKFNESELECDHIIPIVRIFQIAKKHGWSDDVVWRDWIYSPKNLRTLCKDCHKIVTAGLIRKLAYEKRVERQNKAKHYMVKGDGNDKFINGWTEEQVHFMYTQGIARWIRFIEKPFLIPPLESFILNV